MEIDLMTLQKDVESIARRAGEYQLRELKNFQSSSIQFKGQNDLVSYVDQQTEKLIVTQLQSLLPSAGFITEEKTVEQVHHEYQWIIDPLDGTTNFVHGLPIFCVSIALIHHGQLVVGVIYDPSKDECFAASKGNGAYLNQQAMQVNANVALNQSLLATGFPYYEFSQQSNYMNLLAVLMQKSHGVRRLGSAALDLAYVACGRFDAFYEYNLNAWDVAAGILLVQEAGGICEEFKGGNDPLFGRSLVSGHAKIVGELQSEIRLHF